jgi:hypothetical protein
LVIRRAGARRVIRLVVESEDMRDKRSKKEESQVREAINGVWRMHNDDNVHEYR